MASGGAGGSGPAELLISRDFCQYIFRRPGCLPAVFLQQSGVCQKYFFILPPCFFKSFLPSEEGPQGKIPYTELISSQLSTAGIQWEQQPSILWEHSPSQVPTALQRGQFGWVVGKQPSHLPSDVAQSLCANPQHRSYLA